MRAAAACGAALAILLAGCGSEESERVDALADAVVQQTAQAADDAALPDDDTPVERAPSTLELSKLCPLGEGTRWDTLRGWVTQGYRPMEVTRLGDIRDYWSYPSGEHKLRAGERIVLSRVWGYIRETANEQIRFVFDVCYHGEGEPMQCHATSVDSFPR